MFDVSRCEGTHGAAFARARASALLSHVTACWVDSESDVEVLWDRARGVLQVRAPALPALLREPTPLLAVGGADDPLPALGAPCCLNAHPALGAPGAVLAMLEGW